MFLKLFWVDDAYFMLTPSWREHLALLGVRSWPVEDTKGNELEGIVQLKADTRVPLAMDDMHGIQCETCGRKRYHYHRRGFFPAPAERPDLPIFRSEQYFGAGHQSSNAIIVNSKVAAVIQSAALRVIELWPCAPQE
ncbi:hypothetical protein ACFQGW_07645 [Xanthomonas theicola]|uniref:hypothetical protein n=1 Tax=Xanthomonas theicola TaxID=56464 RepID=UPI0011B04B6C|nr:hypothetical protein [Xanthomonas theicola]